MKKLVVLVLIAVVCVLGYRELRSSVRLDFASLRGETVRVGRGDLTIPINATGEVGPVSRHEIKSEASGEVIEIRHYPGDMVSAGALLIRLKRDEEQRSVNRAEEEVRRAEALLEQARIKERRLRGVGIKHAELVIEQFDAQLELAKFMLDKTVELDREGRASPDEMIRVQTRYDELLARRAQAQADLEDARIAVEAAKQDVILAKASAAQAKTALGDARERLEETDIASPIAGMVVAVETHEGEVIQGGKTTLVGGTVLAVVADVSKQYVRAQVDEADIGAVRELAPAGARPGRAGAVELAASRDSGGSVDAGEPVPISQSGPVKVTVESFREEEFYGLIERIHPEPSSKASAVVTYQVDILLTSENRDKLLSGMQADVEFTAKSARDVVLVPHEAIRRNEDGALGVWIPEEGEGDERGKGKRFVPCRLGLDNGMYAEVVAGLEEGTEVYTVVPRRIKGDDDER